MFLRRHYFRDTIFSPAGVSENFIMWRSFDRDPGIFPFEHLTVPCFMELKERRICLAQHKFIIGRRHYV